MIHLKRPIAYQKGVTGNIDTVIPGGVYKLVFSTTGLLGENFSVNAYVVKTNKTSLFSPVPVSGIPTLDIQMSEAMFQVWDIQRATYAAQIKNPPICRYY